MASALAARALPRLLRLPRRPRLLHPLHPYHPLHPLHSPLQLHQLHPLPLTHCAPAQATLLRLLSKHDLGRRAPAAGLQAHEAAHVSNASQKESLRALLRADTTGVAASLAEMRQTLGYGPPTAAREGRARGGAHERRRWVLATLSQD